MLHQHVGVHDGDQLMQEIRLGLKQLRGQLPHHLLQLLCSMRWHTIPCLWLSPSIEITVYLGTAWCP